ncbi:MAG: hypothetical protein O3B75_02300, partial [Planctomycetota bacterium]|nr:hypothetical protein [Planctomycetota bacterium]
MKYFSQTILWGRYTVFMGIVFVGCVMRYKPPEVTNKSQESAPVDQTTIQHEEDVVVVLYDASDPSARMPTSNSRVRLSESGVSDSQNQPRRTSMPSRDQKSKKSPPVGGVRKASPVDHTASELFGKWRVD